MSTEHSAPEGDNAGLATENDLLRKALLIANEYVNEWEMYNPERAVFEAGVAIARAALKQD